MIFIIFRFSVYLLFVKIRYLLLSKNHYKAGIMRCSKILLSEINISWYLIIVMIIYPGCDSTDSSVKDYTSYVSEIQEWHKERIELLKEKNGVLSVMGLYWLKEGENSFGSNPSNDIVLPEDLSPEFTGSFFLNNGEVRIKVKPGIEVMYEGEAISEMVLKSDISSEMTILDLGRLNWFIIERNEEFGVRFRDNENPRIRQFKDVETFKIDPAWRFEARFEPYEPVKTVTSVTASGATRKYPSPGALIFKMNKSTYRLDPISLSDTGRYLLIFGDMTNGEETYGGGRFLYIERPREDSTTILDFNKSINPPCAISEFFVCPMPPQQNRLMFKVTAGEKKYEKLTH